MNANESRTRFDPASRLFIWEGPHAERNVPQEAGFTFDAGSRRWVTASPFIAFMLAPGLSELQHIAARIEASKARTSAIAAPFPAGMKAHAFQIAGIAFCRSLRYSYIADEPRLGKTVQSIGLANLQGYKKVLVIAPAHLRVNWRREVENWYIGDPANWHVVSFEHMADNASRLKQDGPYDLIVVDEAHYIKEPTSRRAKMLLGTKAIQPLIHFAKQVTFLSGTPAPNRALELWPILRACAPWSIADCLSYEAFAERFHYVFRDEYGELVVKGSRREDELFCRLRGSLMVRRLKSDVALQLPKKQFSLIVFPQDSETAKVVKKERPFSVNEILRNGVPSGPDVDETRREMGIAKIPAVVQRASHLLENGVKKICLFAHHRDVVLGLAKALEAYGAVSIVGGMTDKKRQAAVDAFSGYDNVRVLVGNLKAAGTGLNLAVADHVGLAEASWVPGENDQVIDRIDGFLQKAARIYIEIYVVEGSIDAAVLGCAAKKRNSTDKFLDAA